MSVRLRVAALDVTGRWPHIRRGLHVNAAGMVDDDYIGWQRHALNRLNPSQLAVAYEQWADYYQWRFDQRAAELATNPTLFRLAAKWTDSMVYSCLRSAVWARGDDPGAPLRQWERRPDLYPASRPAAANRPVRRLVAAAAIR